jgi:hypothetical protein
MVGFVAVVVLAALMGLVTVLLFRVLIGPQGTRGGRRVASGAPVFATRRRPMLDGKHAVPSAGARPRETA